MMAGSITLGTYDTFNYFAAQAEKRSSPWVSRMARSEIDNLSPRSLRSSAFSVLRRLFHAENAEGR
jgi:hypothetical protein